MDAWIDLIWNVALAVITIAVGAPVLLALAAVLFIAVCIGLVFGFCCTVEWLDRR